jgi:hypothetical protein
VNEAHDFPGRVIVIVRYGARVRFAAFRVELGTYGGRAAPRQPTSGDGDRKAPSHRSPTTTSQGPKGSIPWALAAGDALPAGPGRPHFWLVLVAIAHPAIQPATSGREQAGGAAGFGQAGQRSQLPRRFPYPFPKRWCQWRCRRGDEHAAPPRNKLGPAPFIFALL